LRGDVPAKQKGPLELRISSSYGDLFHGPGERITAHQCRLFILRCTQRLWELPLDEPSRQALSAYRQYALEGAPRDEFFKACLRIHDLVSSGGTALVSHLASGMWTDQPAGAASAAIDCACTIANVKANESVAITCANATEEDWFAWSFCGGPPDPVWQATRAEEERFQAGVLREIVGDPFRT
jgi:hypothetical protein